MATGEGVADAGVSYASVEEAAQVPAYMVGMSNIHAARKYGKRWRKTTALNQSDDAAPASGAKYSVQPEALECGDEGLPAEDVPRLKPEPSRTKRCDLESDMAQRRGSAALKRSSVTRGATELTGGQTRCDLEAMAPRRGSSAPLEQELVVLPRRSSAAPRARRLQSLRQTSRAVRTHPTPITAPAAG